VLFHVIANIALAVIGVQRDLRSLQHQRQLGLVQMNAPEQTVQCRVAGLLGEDRVKSTDVQFFKPLSDREQAVFLNGTTFIF